MDTSRARILQFIEYQNISSKFFLEKTNLKKGFVDRSHVNSSASDIHLSKILEAFPELSAEWLLTGRGSMLRSDKESQSTNQSVSGNPISGSNIKVNSGNKRTQKPSPETTDNALVVQLAEKDKQINNLIEQQSRFLEQIDKLIEQQNKLISKL